MYNLKNASEGLKNYRCIYKYLKGKHGQRIGVLLGCIKNDEQAFNIGWSLCHKKDRFDKEKAVKVAFLRSVNGSAAPLPRAISTEYQQFVDRCFRYFKNCPKTCTF